MLQKLIALRGTEPVRLFVWPAILVIVGLALTKGIIDGEVATALYALIPLVLGVPVEIARANVTPAAKAVGKHAAIDAINDVQATSSEFARLKLGSDAGIVVDSVAEQIKAGVRGL